MGDGWVIIGRSSDTDPNDFIEVISGETSDEESWNLIDSEDESEERIIKDEVEEIPELQEIPEIPELQCISLIQYQVQELLPEDQPSSQIVEETEGLSAPNPVGVAEITKRKRRHRKNKKQKETRREVPRTAMEERREVIRQLTGFSYENVMVQSLPAVRKPRTENKERRKGSKQLHVAQKRKTTPKKSWKQATHRTVITAARHI